MDVEDVRGTLAPYHALLRDQLEHYGGTVEKFIGDAVMALFGAPVTHEDDPERAVRAALSIRAAIDRLNEQEPGLDLHVRVGVNTGEALVVLGADAGRGEGVASGDVVNTAARLQSAAPVDGILVGETTYHATDRAITYRQVEPVVAKGKARPVPAWEAVEARARFGVDVVQRPTTPLVGRGAEVDLLLDALRRCRAERAVQLVTLVGVPGIGKSRLVWELFEAVEREPDFVTWRQGRSLPYGDGVTYWALGEMITAQSGILDSDTADEARRQAQGDRGGPDRRSKRRPPGSKSTCGRWRASRPTAPVERRPPERSGVGLATLSRGARGAQPARARVRGPALGRRRTARLRRPSRRSGGRRADARGLHRSPGAARSPRRMGRRQAQRAHDRPLAARRRRCRAHDRRPAGAGRAPGRDAGHAPCDGAGKPALRRGVRPDAHRPRAPAPGRGPVAAHGRRRAARPRVGARADRRPARRPAGRSEAAASGRRGAGQGRLAAARSCRWAAPTGSRWRSGSTGSSAARCCGASGARRWAARSSTPSGTSSCATSPTARSRGPSGPTSTGARRNGSSRSPLTARTPRTCWPTTTRRRSSTPATRVRRPAISSGGRVSPSATRPSARRR